MTCIVGMIRGSNVYLGCDSAASCTSQIGTIKNISEKLFVKKISDRFNIVYGYTSSFRMGQILRYGFKEPEIPKEILELKNYCTTDEKLLDNYLVNEYVDALRTCFKDKGFLEIEGNQEGAGNFLIGITDSKKMFKPRLYAMQKEFSLLDYTDDYTACGSGDYFALGALYVLHKNKKAVPLILQDALYSATQNPYVKPPFIIKKI